MGPDFDNTVSNRGSWVLILRIGYSPTLYGASTRPKFMFSGGREGRCAMAQIDKSLICDARVHGGHQLLFICIVHVELQYLPSHLITMAFEGHQMYSLMRETETIL